MNKFVDSSYNLTDGENSSGVSSCCTSASTAAGNVTVTSEIISAHALTNNNNNNKNRHHYSLTMTSKKNENDTSRPTHRVQFSFIPRHNDEILLEVGDALHVERTDEDHWCYGLLFIL